MCLVAAGSVRAEEDPPPGDMGVAGPHLLPVDHPVVAVALGPGASSDARSEPAPGSENSWHQNSSPLSSGQSQRSFCSSVPAYMRVGPAHPMPIGLIGRRTPARRSSSSIMSWVSGSASSP